MTVRFVRPPRTKFCRLVASIATITLCSFSLAACGSSRKSSTSKANSLIQAGITAADSGNVAAAISDYRTAITDNPSSAIAYYDLGVIFQQQHDVALARAYYDQSLSIAPRYKSALFNLAILDTSAFPGQAVQLYDKLLTINPDDPNVLFNLGLLLRSLGQTTQGNADIGKAVKLNPNLASRIPRSLATSSPSTTS